MEIVYTPDFEKSYRKLPKRIRDLAIKKTGWFCVDPYDTRLKTHALQGKLFGKWAFSINFQYRIIFKFVGTDRVLFLLTGTHNVYK